MRIPPGFSAVTPYFFVDGAEGFVDFLVRGLGGRELLRSLRPDGHIGNVQVSLNGATVMVSEASRAFPAMAAAYYLYVADADAAMAQALEPVVRGATIARDTVVAITLLLMTVGVGMAGYKIMFAGASFRDVSNLLFGGAIAGAAAAIAAVFIA